MGEAISLDRLCEVPKGSILVSVPCTVHDVTQYVICEIEVTDDFRIGTEVRPPYPIEGTFTDGHDEPRIGQEICSRIIRDYNLFVRGHATVLDYGRIYETVPSDLATFRRTVIEFVSNLMKAIPIVDKMVQDYLNLPIDDDLARLAEKYLPGPQAV